ENFGLPEKREKPAHASGSRENAALATRAKIAATPCGLHQFRGRLERFNSRPEWLEIRRLLYRGNLGKTGYYLDALLRIPPHASLFFKAERLLDMLGERSPCTRQHSINVKQILQGFKKSRARAFGGVDFKKAAFAMELHDIGKLCFTDPMLNENIRFNEQEHRIKEDHPRLGALVLSALGFDEKVIRIVLAHHLKMQTLADGSLRLAGYPVEVFKEYCGLKGLDPELTAEDHIAGFADAFSAMTQNRPFDKYNTRSARREEIFEIMDHRIFSDPYYHTGPGAPLYAAFKKAACSL
ncbi:HD domain-containing protein, partial [Candidatus Peregrinibacteria bacterium]|nr:HD domain-containing protein [Candidatus Peregrinibacteria bacterium]